MIILSQKGEVRPFQLNETDHLNALVDLSEMELLQGSVCFKLEQFTCILYSSKETRLNDVRLQTLFSKMPKKRPNMSQHVKTFDPASLPACQAVMNQNSSESMSWPIHGSVPIWTTSHTRTRFPSLAWSKLRLGLANHRAGYFSNLTCDWLSIAWAYSEQETENGPWKQLSMMEISPLWLTVIKCPRKCSMKMMELLVTTITLMVNTWHLLRMKVNKIEGTLTRTMNTLINIILWMNIWPYSMRCCNSSVN